MARIHMLLIFLTVALQCYHLCDAQCQIDGFTNWLTPLQDSVVDTHIGTFFVRNTNNIIGITSIVHRDGLNRGPYLDISILDSQLRIGTNNAFEEYEENETSQSIGATITFSCSGSQSSGVLVVTIDIIDTNNNAPRFLPTNQYEFTVIPPLPPGFLVTGCENQITVRDIDLTTQRIDFTIDNNPDFEIFLDTSSSAPKEFRAVIRTKSFLRSIPEPLNITITATDVDLTNDLPLTEKASILIVPNQVFLLPDELIFSRTFYIFNYINEQTLVAEETISLIQGFDKEVVFNLEGQYSEYFQLLYPNDNEITLALRLPLTSEIVEEGQIFLILRGEREHTSGSSVTLIVQFPNAKKLGFSSPLYKGLIENKTIKHETIILNEGYTDDVVFDLEGEYAYLFNVSNNLNQVLLNFNSDTFEDVITTNNVIFVTVTANAINALSTSTAVVFEIIKNVTTPAFSQNIYEGTYVNASLIDIEYINLIHGLQDDLLSIQLHGDFADYFRLDFNDNDIILSLRTTIPEDVIYTEKVLVMYITASREENVSGNAAIIIRFPNDMIEPRLLSFSKYTYKGALELTNRTLIIEDIVLEIGFTDDVNFEILGDYSNYFRISNSTNIISIATLDELFDQDLTDKKLLVLNVRAESERAISGVSTVVIDLITHIAIQPMFNKAYYIGRFSKHNGLEFDDVISLERGFDETVIFELKGDNAQWFYIDQDENSVTLLKNETNFISDEILENNNHLLFTIVASKPEALPSRAAISIELIRDSPTELEATFDKVLYSGQVLNNVVTHEPITVLRYSGEIILSGEFEDLFMASLTNGAVSVQLNSSFFPTDLQYVVLKMTALEASSVLLLDVVQIDVIPPMLSFSSPNYSIQINELQTGIIGQVTATADNGETVVYALKLDNEHLGERLSINSKGEIHASAPIITGSYSFGIVASTIFTGVTANAAVYLTVVNSTSCEIDDSITPLPPLLIIERYEEEPHWNLVPLDRNIYPDCKYQLTNVWPIDQTWLYVDDNGLHTTSIDREHESIGFMHVSQIQVELNLFCGDESRRKRSLGTDVQYDLRSYDYGQNHWILTDNIPHNPTRTLVNLIVLDINDNAPVFVGKENEPIIVGYPHRNIEEIVLPRALVELKATDADIGENAELLYWSSEENIVVSPKDGSVHVRNHASLEDNSRLTVHATDRNGDGLTGSIEVLVRLLDANHIAVITVRNAFIGDETQILENFSRLLGYDVKTLRSAVISERLEDDLRIISRAQLQTDAAAASLRLYVYGLQYQNPVDVTQLITDLNSNIVTVSLAQVLSLEDHLEGMQRCPVAEREIGFLVATIVLAALLFILIVVVAVWFALKWKNKSPYEQFSDQNSLASRNQSIESPKTDNATLPRIDLEELRKSEKRLQDLLDTPVEDVGETIEPFNAKQQVPAYNVAFDIPNEITPTSSTERSNDSNVSIDGNNQFSEETIPSNNVTFEIPETTIASNTVNFDLPIETIVNISSNNPNGPIVIQSIDKLKDNIDESEDDDEFGERQRARRKSMVTFNENVEKIIHLEDRQSDDESNPDIEIYKF